MKKYTQAAQKFYRGKAWRSCRKAFIAIREGIDGGMCEHCQEEPGYIVDHIQEINENNITDPDITLNHQNLQFLCLTCHNKKTNRKNLKCKFDSSGHPTHKPYPPYHRK